MTGAPEQDGPWRVAPRIRIIVSGAAGKSGVERVAAGLRALGLDAADIRTVMPGDMAALLPRFGDRGYDALVLDGATEIAPEAVAELRRVADGDPMLLAVMPRFLGHGEEDLPLGARPPTADYTVLPDLRCLYIKGAVLADTGDEPEGDSPSPRATIPGRLVALNRFGFRIAVAGRALARHPAGDIPSRAADAPPGWRPALARRLASAPAAADRLLGGLRPGSDGRRAIAFDLAHLGPGHSGTTRLAAALVRRAVARWPDFALHAIAGEAAFAAHLGSLGSAITRVDPADPRPFAAAIRFGQPFLWREVDALAARAPVLVLFLLDTIGLDCLRHAPDELDALWRFVCGEADGLLFNSAFTQRQFARRFAFRAGLPCRASLHSLDLADYRADRHPSVAARVGVLVIGNGFAHKRLRETAGVVARAGLPEPVTVLGLDPGAVPGTTCIASGGLAPERLAALYATAKIVVYPSLYEGFGFPLLEALAHRTPVLIRPLPPYTEIAAALPEAANIHTYADDADLVRRLRDPPAWSEARESVRVRTWDDAADDLRAVLDAALDGVQRDRVVRRIDLLRGRMSYLRTRALAGDGADETLDRMAGAAGRLAQGAVTMVGGRVPSPLVDLLGRAFGRGR